MNAIELAVEALAPVVPLEPREVEIGGLTFLEVVTRDPDRGRRRRQRRPGARRCSLNFRYAPGRSRDEAEARLRELAGDVEIRRATRRPRPCPRENAARRAAARRRRASRSRRSRRGRRSRSSRSAASTRSTSGPGATRYAHRVDEQVEIAELVRTFEALTRASPSVPSEPCASPPCSPRSAPTRSSGSRRRSAASPSAASSWSTSASATRASARPRHPRGAARERRRDARSTRSRGSARAARGDRRWCGAASASGSTRTRR